MANRIVVYFGPRKAFDELVDKETSDDESTVGYLDSIRTYNARIRATTMISGGPDWAGPKEVDNCVVHADDFGSVLSHVISNFATTLEESFDIHTLYVQNPPTRALDSLEAAYPGAVEYHGYDYRRVGKDDLPAIFAVLKTNVLGQKESKKTLIASLYRLSVMTDDRPSAILLYGPSGVGKTETARSLSEAMGGSLTRVQFSMMQTNEAYEYLFGAEHSKASFARDLLGRESNVVLIDEFDKVNPGLYNMFYQLFDEGRYVDTNYDVNMRNGLFLLTSNFASESDARRAMGPAMFSRISECVSFEDLSAEAKVTIAQAHYDEILEKLTSADRETIEKSGISDWFAKNASRYDNMRTLKNKVEKAIFEKLSAPIIEG